MESLDLLIRDAVSTVGCEHLRLHQTAIRVFIASLALLNVEKCRIPRGDSTLLAEGMAHVDNFTGLLLSEVS